MSGHKCTCDKLKLPSNRLVKPRIRYHLSQKHCDCQSDLSGCCEDGWQVTLAGSWFLIGPEQRYVVIEGEALAIAWALEQTKYFTLGCKNLIVATDHKPLVAIFQDKELTQIANPRIFRLKQRSLWWTFKIVYLAGSTNQQLMQSVVTHLQMMQALVIPLFAQSGWNHYHNTHRQMVNYHMGIVLKSL